MGLRSQLGITLFIAFMASFALLGTAALQLSKRARQQDLHGVAHALAQVLARSWERTPQTEHAPNNVEALLRTVPAGVIRAVRVQPWSAESWTWGQPAGRAVGWASLAEGGRVSVWLNTHEQRDEPLRRLLLFYIVTTGSALLFLTYLGLTSWIIRPMATLTAASEALASGRVMTRVPERGAAEIARLARSFNRMAQQIAGDKEALESQLRELSERTEQLRQTQTQLVRSEHLASVGKLAAGIAHEIGNPLSAVLGFVELLKGGGLSDAQHNEFLSRVQRETERIHKIIRDLLDFARQESSKNLVGESDLCATVEETIALLLPHKEMRDITLERRFYEEPLWVHGPSDALTQIILNLLLNALDAISGQGTILVEVGSVDTADGFIRISDSGPGIAAEIIDQLFEPFVTTKPAGHGTGLGLSVCHGLVTSLGGKITASNPPAGGACFEIILPLASKPIV